MDTKDLDIVYFVKSAGKNEELVYSLRSICENMEFRNVWFFGGCPAHLQPDKYVWRDQLNGKAKWDNTATLMKLACESPGLSENFILFNDDFFVMKKIKRLRPIYWGTLEELADTIEKKRNHGYATRYTMLLRNAASFLELNDNTSYNYELHVPMIINKKKMLEVIQLFPTVHCKRSLYGNLNSLHSKAIEMEDVKIHSLEEYRDTGKFLSTDDTSFISGEPGKIIREKFKKPSRFERLG